MTSLRAGHFAHMRRRARVTTSAHALGSPARGAVAARSGVTEGLCITWVRRNNITSQPTQPPTVGAYLPRPPGVGERTTSDTRTKWCAGCARGIGCVGGRRHRARRINRGCNRPRRPSATTPPRQSRDRGASGTPPLTGGSETGLAAYNVTGVENCTSRLR